MQWEMDEISSACDNYGLTTRTQKTEAMCQSAPGNPYHEPNITAKGQRLQAMGHFICLGSTLSRSANIDAEVNRCLAKASNAFGRLRKTVWEWREISLRTRMKVYTSVALTTLLHVCETCTIYRRHEKQHQQKLQQFNHGCLRNILNIWWRDKFPNTKVLERAGLPRVFTMRKAQIRWAGHVYWMADTYPQQLYYGELHHGWRKVYLKNFNINTTTWGNDKPTWHSLIHKGATNAEAVRIIVAEEIHGTWKSRALNAAVIPPTHWCQTLGRGFHAHIGLISHMRKHCPSV